MMSDEDWDAIRELSTPEELAALDRHDRRCAHSGSRETFPEVVADLEVTLRLVSRLASQIMDPS